MVRTSFKERIRQEWDSVAEDWGDPRWWSFVERAAQSCSERLVELATIVPGQRVLDVGTGVGEPAVTAARRVGPAGWVLGIDLAPRMIAAARRRVDCLGLSNVELEVGDAESLHLDPESFDAILSRWTLMLMEDLESALAGLRRLLRPGGWLAAGFWGHPSRVPMIAVALETVFTELGSFAVAEPVPDYFWPRGAAALEEIALQAGFSEVRTEIMELAFELPSPESYARFVCRMAGPLRLLVEQLPQGRQEDLLAVLGAAVAPFTGADGTVRLVNETLLLAGSNR